MKVSRVKLSSLVADPQNPRHHNEKNMQAIVDSLQAHGQVEPLLVQKSTRMIIAGNGRAAALRRLEKTHADVVMLDVSDEEARALSIRMNRTGELASWNEDVLAEHLSALEALEDAIDFGFDEEDLSALTAQLDASFEGLEPEEEEKEKKPLNYEFEVDESEIEAKTYSGDIVKIGKHRLYCADCVNVMRGMDDNSIDAIVTDPPYGIAYQGKEWDSALPGEDWARECFRVLKPGGHIIAFAATRTIHRLMVSIEDAGFELRDCLAWLFYTGFPKSADLKTLLEAEKAKHWQGYGTNLKPAYEPAVLARKPLEGTIAQNLERNAVGVLNIDACRYPHGHKSWPGPQDHEPTVHSRSGQARLGYFSATVREDSFQRDAQKLGRWPANVYHCPKPSRAEREVGCEDLPSRTGASAVGRKEGSAGMNSPRAGAGRTASDVKNWHPTVKPVELMRWMVRLVGCKKGSVVLDTFVGSGTTMVAAELEGFRSIGIELDERHCDIVRARVEHAVKENE